jgi:hypothetical protein
MISRNDEGGASTSSRRAAQSVVVVIWGIRSKVNADSGLKPNTIPL